MKKFAIFGFLILTTSLCSDSNHVRDLNKHPSEIVERIIRSAEEMYPNDYSMQRWKIEHQMKEYTKVLEYKNFMEQLKKQNAIEKGK